MAERSYLVTVCAACLRASCWHGENLCESARTARVRQLRASDLDTMMLEDRGHYSPEKLLAVTGQRVGAESSGASLGSTQAGSTPASAISPPTPLEALGMLDQEDLDPSPQA